MKTKVKNIDFCSLPKQVILTGTPRKCVEAGCVCVCKSGGISNK